MKLNSFVKSIVGGICALVATVGVGTIINLSSSSDVVDAQPAPNIYSVPEAKAVLDKNLSEAQLQKEQELAEVEKTYELPAEGTFETEYSFPELNDQRSQADAQLMQRSSGDSKFEVEKVWYEPGYFKSDALVQWQCAWLKEAVLAQESADRDRFDTAISQLRGFTNREEASMFPDYDVFLNENVVPLEHGKDQAARDFLNSGYSCVKQNQINN